jgi:hypothetical protein
MDLSAPMNLASVVQAGASVFGFLFVGYQLRQARRNIRGATEHTLYVHYTKICKLLIGKPHLRPYFYENKTMLLQDPDNPHLREEIDMMSEAILGLIEHSALHEKNLPSDTWNNCWMPYAHERLDKSREMRDFFAPNRAWYTATLRRVIDGYLARVELFEIWRKLHGAGPIKAADLSEAVISKVMGARAFWYKFPEQLGLRRFIVSRRLDKLTDTPVAGSVLQRQTRRRHLPAYVLVSASGGAVPETVEDHVVRQADRNANRASVRGLDAAAIAYPQSIGRRLSYTMRRAGLVATRLPATLWSRRSPT